MSINLVAICDNDKVAKELEQTCEKLGYTINCEIQGAGGITATSSGSGKTLTINQNFSTQNVSTFSLKWKQIYPTKDRK